MAWAQEKTENYYDVVIVGAGISGINFGYRLQERNPNLKYLILEGRHEIGGTWSLFNYPGIRSDSDLYTFGFAWRPWSEQKSIASGGLIRQYLKDSAAQYGIDKKIKYKHFVNSANFSTSEQAWTLSCTADGKPATFKARFMLLGTGYYDYNNPLAASIPGIESFKGTVIHPQFWPEAFDYTDKEVVVIGSGATAVTVLPVMAQTAKHVTMLQRSPGYVISINSNDWLERFLRTFFSWWPAFMHFAFRAKWIFMSFFITTLSSAFPRLIQAALFKRMEKALPKNIPRDPHFTPKYYPWQQRMCLCPDNDFYLGLHSGKASVETGVIKTVTPTSIQLESGRELKPDVIVTATGLKLQFAGGIAVSVDKQAYDVPSKFIWRGCMLEDLPNAAFSFGYVDASWTLGADATAQLLCRMLKTMAAERAVVATPRRSAHERQHLKSVSPLRLNSTYVTAGAAVTPLAGDSGPWIPRSWFIKDMWNAWYGDLHKGVEYTKA